MYNPFELENEYANLQDYINSLDRNNAKRKEEVMANYTTSGTFTMVYKPRKKVLITGCAGFIGFHTCKRFLKKYDVIGIDNLNNAYDVRLKKKRLSILKDMIYFKFIKMDIRNKKLIKLFKKYRFDLVINLAAMAGVNESFKNPDLYYSVNCYGTLNILRCVVEYPCKMIQASTSGVYGNNTPPFKEDMKSDAQSPYTTTKHLAECVCRQYARGYKLDILVTRFFTVYGMWGRPQMSIFRFINQIDRQQILSIHGDGEQERSFTFIDDIVNGLWRARNWKGFDIVNLGNDKPVKINDVVSKIAKELNTIALYNYEDKPVGLNKTQADITKAYKLLKWKPMVNIDTGIKVLCDWYKKNKKFMRGIKL